MTRPFRYFFYMAMALSLILAVASIAAASWTAKSGFPLGAGVQFGNKEIFGYRQGADFRIAFFKPSPVVIVYRLRAQFKLDLQEG